MPTPAPTPASSPTPTSAPSSAPLAPFDPNSTAGSTTDPGSTGTDVYGLTPQEEQWTFYLGEAQNNTPATRALDRHLPTEDRPTRPPNGTYGTALDLMKKYAALGSSSNPSDRQAFANLQQQLLALGAYGTSGSTNLVRFGTWTDLDAQAMLRVFKSYQQVAGKDGAGQPISFEEYVNQAAAQSAANGQAGGTGSSNPVLLTDPDTLKRYAQMAAQAALGRNLTADQLSTFVDQFHQQQISAAGAPGGALVDKNDPRASAIDFVTQQNSQEFGQHQVQGYTDSFLNMFLPNSSAAPNVNVDPTAVGY